MRSDTEAIIKVEIEHVFGRKIVSSRDCIHLSDEIFSKTKFKLNPNTLRRFFGLVRSRYPASRATLNILCNYCGFRSIDEVQALKHRDTAEADSIHVESILNYFLVLFNEIPVGNDQEGIFFNLVKHTICFLDKHPAIIERFQRLIVKTRYGNEFYFEQFVNTDKLNNFYGDGLRYYLTEKSTPEAQVFAHSLLVFRYWLTNNDHKLEVHYKEMMKHKPGTSDSPVLYGHYYAALLFHTHVRGLSPATIINDIFHFHSLAIPPAGRANLFESIVTEALVLTGNYEEGLFYSDFLIKKFTENEHTEDYRLQNAYLFNAVSLYKTSDLANAARMMRRIRPSQFHFLNKQYLTILYGQLAGKTSRKLNDNSEEQVGELVQKTGFTRIATL